MPCRGVVSRQLAEAPAATASKAQPTTACQPPGWHGTDTLEKHPLVWPVCSFGSPRPPDWAGWPAESRCGWLVRASSRSILDSHVLLEPAFLLLQSHLSTRTTHGICSAGFPLPCCLSPPQFMHLQELAGRSSHLQGLLPRRCYQDHLPRSVRFGCDAERLCDRRRPRLRQPASRSFDLFSPRPRHRHSFSPLPCLVGVEQSLLTFFSPTRPHRRSLPTARTHVQRQ